MLKTTLKALAAAAALATATTASAATIYQDIDKIDLVLTKGSTPVTGTFNLNQADDLNVYHISGYTPENYAGISTNGTFSDIGGYDPITQNLLNAYAFFYLTDALHGNDRWEVAFSALTVASSQGPASSASYSFFHELTGSTFTVLNESGTISYSITNDTTANAANSAFRVDYARLVGIAELKQQQPHSNVPDGGASIALLGLALTAVGALRRKLGMA